MLENTPNILGFYPDMVAGYFNTYNSFKFR